MESRARRRSRLDDTAKEHLFADSGRERDQGDFRPRALAQERNDLVVAEVLDRRQRPDRPAKHRQEHEDQRHGRRHAQNASSMLQTKCSSGG